MNRTHCLIHGRMLCGAHEGPPCDWGPEETWLSEVDWPKDLAAVQKLQEDYPNASLCTACNRLVLDRTKGYEKTAQAASES